MPEGTDTMFYIRRNQVPAGKKVTYANVICDYRLLKDDPYVIGGETNGADMIAVGQGANNAGVQQTVSRKRNRRKCCNTVGCFDRFGETCPKMYSKQSLLLEDQGVCQPRLTRTPHPRKCGSCDITGCPAQNDRTKCLALVGNGPAT